MKRLTLLIAAVAVATLLAGCGEVAELTLDDEWALKEIQTDAIQVDNLDDHLEIEFDAVADRVSITVGPGWERLSPQDPTGTYEFEVVARNSTIVLRQNDEAKHEITYELDNELRRMTWTRWEAVDPDPDIVIVSPSSTITAIVFQRIEE